MRNEVETEVEEEIRKEIVTEVEEEEEEEISKETEVNSDKMVERKDVETVKVTRNPGTSTLVSQIGVFKMVDDNDENIVVDEIVAENNKDIKMDEKENLKHQIKVRKGNKEKEVVNTLKKKCVELSTRMGINIDFPYDLTLMAV